MNNGIKQLAQVGLVSALALGSTQTFAGWSDSVNVSGYTAADIQIMSGDTVDSIDMTLFEFSMSIDAQLNDRVSATVGLLYEENATDFGLDVGYLSMQASDAVTVHLGLMDLPFGSYNTNMANDTFALSLGETYETAFAATYDVEGMSFTGYFFNGEVRETGDDDTVNSFGFRVSAGTDEMGVTLDYITNLSDADAYSTGAEVIIGEIAGGLAVAAHGAMGPMMVHFEYLAALDPIAGAEVESTGIELGYAYEGDSVFAFGVQTSDEAAAFLPETRISFGYSTPFMEVLTLNTELYLDEQYNDNSDVGFIARFGASF